MCKVILNQTSVIGNRVDFSYVYPDAWNGFIVDPDERLFIEYDFPLSNIPTSILNIPFVSNMLILAMFEDGDIYVEELDKDFFYAIPQILDGYRWLYPDRKISCHVHCAKLVDNSYTPGKTRLLAFTGGVDATSALASHVGEDLLLVNIWGGDIRLDNKIRYQSHTQYFEQLAQNLGIGFAPIKSNFRFLYDETKIPYNTFEHDWWAAIAHSLLIVATFAPLAYQYRAEKVYLASTYTDEEYLAGRPHDCNYSGIVNSIKIASSSVVQCDGHLTRIQKVQNIVEKLKFDNSDGIRILACWNHEKDSIVNCCRCEKCARTIMNITACKVDPNLFGFAVNEETYAYIKELVCGSNSLPEDLWKEIKNAFLKEKKYWRKYKSINWIFKLEINPPRRGHPVYMKMYWKLRQLGGLAKRRLKSVLK